MWFEHTHTQCPVPLQGDLHEHLLATPEGQYDARIAEFMASASAWAYSDLGAFSDFVCRRGLDGNIVRLSVRDTALLVDVTVFVFQSDDKKLGIVAHRGTKLGKVLDWVTDCSATQVPFMTGAGRVHSGMYNNLIALGPIMKELLAALYTGQSITNRLDELMKAKPGKRPASKVDSIGKGKPKIEALYLTGHGIGGSLSMMAAASVAMAPKLAPALNVLRGIYAFGPLRFADTALAAMLDKKLGERTFNHMYQRDVLTKLPSRAYGRYMQFGRRYVSSWIDGTWVQEARPLLELSTTMRADMIGTMAVIKELMYGGRAVIPVEIGDHAPMNYVRVSRNTSPDPEMP